VLEFDWLIHYSCNYRCPYCFFEGMWDEVSERNVYPDIDEVVEAWKNIYREYGDMKIIITGGEPFRYPGFLELISKLEKFSFLAFDTNLSVDKNKLEEYITEVNSDRITMGLSFHPINACKENFVEKAIKLAQADFNIRIHYVTYPPHLIQMKDYMEYFMDNGLRFTPIPFRGTFNGKSYPDAFTEHEKKMIYDVTSNIDSSDSSWSEKQVEQVKSRGVMCAAGQYYARVDSDGTVYPCGQDYTESMEKIVLGNIFNVNFRMRNEPLMCRQERCPCEFRWIIKKD
jgi:MoaA/NifB/PqqE/SkfB family radical SAM enzyme